ncbi:tetratricopeptide repeat protein [Caulobacter sp. NIBR2454]|uniref:tetratricopeptide repeat protein n=1 Tax=Caulobacter sp. NIBR2454 TaxID=3015996 RepID=UPI0022B63E3A|nr:tetratricopeptide repeat protein [Caulobacter sp. NIBR2454]
MFRTFAIVGAAAFATFAIAGKSQAATIVIGQTLAGSCSRAAMGGLDDFDSLQLCERALREDALPVADRAGTLVNRGVIKLRRKDYASARSDFDDALALQPQLGDAMVNRAAILIAEGRYAEAVAEIDRGLALQVETPEKAFFNRGIAHEGLQNLNAAYRDYARASELAPAWDAPKTEMARFQVRKR